MEDIKRGEIFYISRGKGDICGSEQQSDRPGIVVSNDLNNANSSTVEVVYLTTQPKTELPTHCVIRSTGKTSTALCEQVHTVAVERIQNYIGQCSDKEMENIDTAIAISLGLDNGIKTIKKYTETIQSQSEEIETLKAQLNNYMAASNNGEASKSDTTEENVISAQEISCQLIRVEAERDVYKNLYETLLTKAMKSEN